MPIKVQKKDGQMEDFDRSKIINGVTKSGATPEEAENITKQIEAWMPTAAQNGMIKSMDVRSKLIEILKATNPTAGAAFETYQKPAVNPPEAPPTGGPPAI